MLALSACNLPDTQKRSDGSDSQGSFFADDVSGSFLNETFQEDISLPKQRVYLMKVCLRDLKHSKPILNHPFLIEELKQEVKTDSTGCLSWNENIALEYLTDPVFIKYDRKIKSTGIHTGSFKVSFAINPWDTDNYHNAIDLSKNKVEPLVDVEAAAEKLSGKSQKLGYDLWVEDGRMFVNDERMGDTSNNNTNYQLKYEFNVSPYIKTKKTSGEVTQYNLKYGSFAARIEVIQRYFVGGDSEKNTYEILSSENVKDAKMEKSILSFSRVLKFKGGPPSKGSLFVRLYLQPSKNVANLKPFVGIFPLGDFRSFRVNNFLKILPSPDFIKELEAQLPLNKDFASQATLGQASSTADDKSVANATSTSKTGSTISWTNIEFDSPVRGLQLLNHKRKISYPAHICFTNNLTQIPLAFQKFKVYGFSQDESKIGEEKPDITSINTGCIYWTDTIEFDIYECRHYKRGFVMIENPDFNLKIKKYYYINPWDDYFGGKDEKAIDNQDVMKTSCDTNNPKRSEIVLEDVTFNTHATMVWNNNINSLLEFNAIKNLGITLHPKVKIPSDVKKDYDHPLETLLDGAYMLRVLIVRNILTTDKMDVIFQKDIPVVNTRSGTIYAELPFNTKDHRLFLTRNTMFLQLLPIKHDKVEAINDSKLQLKNETDKIEDLINNETSLVLPIFTQELVMDGESHKTLRTFSGSEYIQHLKIDFINQNGKIDFSKLVDEFKAKSQKAASDDSKRIRPEVYAQSQNLEYTDDSKMGSLPFGSWIKNTLETHDTTIDRKTGEQLCDQWFQKYWNGKLGIREVLLRRACSSAAAANMKYFFDFDRVYFVKSVDESTYVGPGTEKAISLGTSFSVSTSYNVSYTNSIGAGIKAGVSGPLLGVFSSVGAEIYSTFDYSRSTSNSDSNSIALGESSSLSVTESRFKIKTTNYLDCISIKPSAKLFQPSSKVWFMQLWDGDIDYSEFFKDNIKEDEKVALTQKGMMVCKAAPSKKPFTFYEQYFWVTQPQVTNEIQDAHDERNKIFTIMIRGKQDYSRFRFYLTQKWQKLENANAAAESVNVFNNMIQMQSWKTSPPGVHINREQ